MRFGSFWDFKTTGALFSRGSAAQLLNIQLRTQLDSVASELLDQIYSRFSEGGWVF